MNHAIAAIRRQPGKNRLDDSRRDGTQGLRENLTQAKAFFFVVHPNVPSSGSKVQGPKL
jgi:hypothetical protein